MSRKRSLTSPVLPHDKGMKVDTIDDDEPPTSWIRPAQFIARIYTHILEKYKKKQHFLYRAFVVFKSQNATISIYSTDREFSPQQFVFNILIENDHENLLSYQHTYNWEGGWFITHLKLLCLLDP